MFRSRRIPLIYVRGRSIQNILYPGLEIIGKSIKREIKFPLADLSKLDPLQECCICLKRLEHAPNKIVMLPCHDTHVFHKSCLSKWSKRSCPLCRKLFC
jgi:hypothetical protein